MMVIIVGDNRVEYCVLTRKQEGLHFFKTRNQLYKVFPDGLKRMRIFDYDGLEIKNEEAIIFRENDTHPYDECDIDYSMDRLLGDVDRHKMMRANGWTKGRGKIWFTNTATSIGTGIYKKIGWPGIIVGLVILYAFVGPMMGLI